MSIQVMNEAQLSAMLDPNTPEPVVRGLVQQFAGIDLRNIEEACSKHSALVAYVNASYEDAELQETRAKYKKEEVEAQCFADAMKADKATATSAGQMVKLDPRFQKALDDYLNRKKLTGRLKALMKSLDHRKEMLVQISAKQRAEMRD